VPAIVEIELVNDTDEDLSDVTISVSATPAFLQPKMFRIDCGVCFTLGANGNRFGPLTLRKHGRISLSGAIIE
jgi:hypothetical protein